MAASDIISGDARPRSASSLSRGDLSKRSHRMRRAAHGAERPAQRAGGAR